MHKLIPALLRRSTTDIIEFLAQLATMGNSCRYVTRRCTMKRACSHALFARVTLEAGRDNIMRMRTITPKPSRPSLSLSIQEDAAHGRESFLQLLLSVLKNRPEAILTGIQPDAFLRYLALREGEYSVHDFADAAVSEALAPSTEMLCLIEYSRVAGPQHQQFIYYARAHQSPDASTHWHVVSKCLLTALYLVVACSEAATAIDDMQQIIACLGNLVASVRRKGQSPLLWDVPASLIVDGLLLSLPVVLAWRTTNGDTKCNVPESLILHLGTSYAGPVDNIMTDSKKTLPSYDSPLYHTCTREEWITIYALDAAISSDDPTSLNALHWSKLLSILL